MAPVPAPCPFCTHASTAFICSQCLTRLLAVYHTQTQAQHQATVSAAEKAKRALVVLNDNRQLKAKAWAKKENIRRAETELARLEGTAVQVRRDIQQRKDALEGRRQRLRHIRAAMIADTASTASSAASTKKSSPGSLSNLQNGQAVLLSAIESIGPELAETRRVLLAETMEALDVRVRRHGPKLQHEVAGLLVPPVHDLLLLPKPQINAILVLLVHVMRLISTYLGLELPFQLLGNLAKPLIRTSHGYSMAEKFSKSYPLYMSSGGSGSSSAHSSGSSQPSSPVTLKSLSSVQVTSKGKEVATAASHAQALRIGIKMLAYNGYYMQQTTRGREESASAGRKGSQEWREDSILSLLYALCTQEKAGLYSHRSAPPYRLRNTELASNSLDFLSFGNRIDALSEEAEKAKAEQVRQKEKQAQTGRGTFTAVDVDMEDGLDPFEIDHPGTRHKTASRGNDEEEEWDVL